MLSPSPPATSREHENSPDLEDPLVKYIYQCYLEDTVPSHEAELITRDLVTKALARVHWRRRQAVILRFGFGGGIPLTLKEVGGHLGVSGERARQIIWQGLDEVYAQIRDLTRLPRKGSL